MTMNTLEDVQRIAKNIKTVGMYVSSVEDKENVSQEELKEAYLNGVTKIEQYLREFKALKLSKEDGKHLSLVRDAIGYSRKSLVAASKGDMMPAKILMRQVKSKMAEYEVRKAKSLKRRVRGG